MEEKRRKAMRRRLMLAAPAAVFAAAWGFLGLFHSPYADWLTVETQRYAVVGQPLDVRVSIVRAAGPCKLAVNAYLLGKNRAVVGRLPAPGPAIPAVAGGTYDFGIDITEKERAAYVQLVIWVSPTGDWRTRTAGANTAPIPVREARPGARDERLKKVVAFANSRSRKPEAYFRANDLPFTPAPLPFWPSPVHLGLAVLLIAGAAMFILLARRVRRSNLPAEGAAGDVRLWTGAAAVLFVLALAEFFLLEERVSRLGRDLVVGLDLYNLRGPYQRLAIALLAAAFIAALVFSAGPLRKRGDRVRLAAAGLALAGYLGLVLAGTLSYHYVDVLERHSVTDLLKAACAAAVLLAGLSLLKRTRPSPGGLS